MFFFSALKSKLEQTNQQHELTLQCVRSTLDGLTCMNRSIDVIISNEDKENKQNEEINGELDENFDENFSILLLSRLNNVCLKLSKNLDFLLRTTFTVKSCPSMPRQESTASSISKQSIDEPNETSQNIFEEMFERLSQDFQEMKTRLIDEENRS